MRSRNLTAIDKAPDGRRVSFFNALALLFPLLAISSNALALSLHDLDPAFERCEAIKSQHSAILPAKSDPFWSLEREQQATVLIYLHEKSMESCTAAEMDALALKAFHQAVEGDRSFLDTLIKARATTLTPAQQTQLQKIGQAELDRLAGMQEFSQPFSLTENLNQLMKELALDIRKIVHISTRGITNSCLALRQQDEITPSHPPEN